MVNNFQRLGSVSNAAVGSAFEIAAQEWFGNEGIRLQRNYGVKIGLSSKKERKFDLGSSEPAVRLIVTMTSRNVQVQITAGENPCTISSAPASQSSLRTSRFSRKQGELAENMSG